MGQSEEKQGAEFTPEQVKIVETLRGLQSEITDVKADLVAKLAESKQECDSLYRELSKVRDELITSKTERRVLSRWYEDMKAERNKLHGELVDVRSALAAVSQERDSLSITLDAWEEADTKPVVKEVADHVLPPVLDPVSSALSEAHALATHTLCHHPIDGNPEPDPANDAKDAKLEFRNGIPTKEMIEVCQWWDVIHFEKAICFKHSDQRPIVWRSAGDYSEYRWKYECCPQPLKPHGMTWQELDKVLADKKAAESPAAPVPSAAVPLCMTCHGCGSPLYQAHPENGELPVGCRMKTCSRDVTARHSVGCIKLDDPYRGPCKSAQPVRHE